MEQNARKIRNLRWLRRLILLWPAVVTAVPLAWFYRTAIHPTVKLLIDTGHPMNDWLAFFEMENDIAPLFVLLVVFIAALTQTGGGLACFGVLLFFLMIVSALTVVGMMFFGWLSAVSMLSVVLFLVSCLALMVLLGLTLQKADDIDKTIEALETEGDVLEHDQITE